MTAGEVARVFRVDPKTVARWGAAGLLPHIKTIGGHRRYLADAVYKHLGVQLEQLAPRP